MNKQTIQLLQNALSGFEHNPCRVIIVAAPSDKEYKKELSNILKSRNILCWDDEDILPGQTIEIARHKAYEEADFILILISKKANSHEGEYQEKIKEAKKAKGKKMVGAIKEIVVCIEECEVPYELEGSQPLEMFSKIGPQKLIEAFNVEFKRRQNFAVTSSVKKFESYWNTNLEH